MIVMPRITSTIPMICIGVLGAASVLYGEKIVILKENEVSFASDFGDIAYISFEKDKLDAKAADLMLEFVGLGFLELRPT